MLYVFTDNAGWREQFPEMERWQYRELRTRPWFGYRADFALGLIPLLWTMRKRYDVILASGLASFSTHSAFLFAMMFKKRFIIWSEDWMWSKRLLARMVLPYVRFLVRHAHAHVVAGTKARQFLLSLGVSSGTIFVAPTAASLPKDIESSDTEATRQQYGLRGKLVFVYVGRVVAYKGLDLLIRAFGQVVAQFPNAALLIAGDGPFAPQCKQLLKELHLPNVVWPHETTKDTTASLEPVTRSSALRFMRAGDVFVLPGRFRWHDAVPSESWGLTMNEASALSKPLLASSSVAAAFDLIKEGVNGFRVHENDSAALAAAMRFFLEHPEAVTAFGKASHSLVTTRCSYEKMCEGFVRAITSTVSSR